MTDFTIIWWAFYWFLPAGIANIAPSLGKRLKFLNYPIDGGLTLRGKPLLGKNKTVKGFLLAIIAGALVGYVMGLLNHGPYPMNLGIGLFQGMGAIIFDSLKSMAKRQVGIKPGHSWIGFDQTDFIIGGLLFASVLYWPGWTFALSVLAIYVLLHLVMNLIGYLVGWNKRAI
ncbi:CDP-archaeol synthase [Candidatus Woesearchaeota archaeon]|nr:CDP-archaeol synthase [Candidatus Woesearchaeota archaeon]